MKYEVTKTFTAGALAGLTITEVTSVEFAVGFRCENPIGGGSPYVVTSVKEVTTPEQVLRNRQSNFQNIEVLNDWIHDFLSEENRAAASAFSTASSALAGLGISKVAAFSAISVLDEHVGDALKDGNNDLVVALCAGLLKLESIAGRRF